MQIRKACKVMQIREACKYASDASRVAWQYAYGESKNEHTRDSNMHQASDIHKGTWMHEMKKYKEQGNWLVEIIHKKRKTSASKYTNLIQNHKYAKYTHNRPNIHKLDS